MDNNHEELLRTENISKNYAAVQVLKGVSITVKRGKILGICGENGAGKSTLINILGGITPKNSGEIIFDTKPYNPKDAKEAIKEGIAVIHQELNLFSNLSVKENIFIGNMQKNRLRIFISRKKMAEDAMKCLSLLDDTIHPDILVEKLAIGQKQMTEIAKALSVNAKLIIFDEPTTSLSTKEKEKLFSVIRQLTSDGMSVIYISHELDDIFGLADEIAVLRDGCSIIQKPKDELTTFEVIKHMVGREMASLISYLERDKGEEIYKLQGLTCPGQFEDINLHICEGEIVGLFGLMGAGRSEVMRAAFGITRVSRGEVYAYGEKMKKLTPERSIRKGIVYLTENRREEGILARKSVTSNLVLANLKIFQRRFMRMDAKGERREAQRMVKLLNIKTHDTDKQLTINLSGGNQQKVVIGKWLMTNPKIIVLDEPTKGVDVGAKFEIYNYINNLAKNKSAILMISSEMEELTGLCDRILVMYRGRITGEVHRDEFSKERLLTHALGRESKWITEEK